MKSIRVAVCALSVACSTDVLAQQPKREDYIIQAREAQLNEALVRDALRRVEDATLIADLRKQVEELKSLLARDAQPKPEDR